MILIVRLFEYAVKLRPQNLMELSYLAGSIALIGLALYLTHASEGRTSEEAADGAAKSEPLSAPSRATTPKH
jgi:hypothetical protein